MLDLTMQPLYLNNEHFLFSHQYCIKSMKFKNMSKCLIPSHILAWHLKKTDESQLLTKLQPLLTRKYTQIYTSA
ncbi:hypothetical protein JHK85_049005 [Glycine max]|uniref:Uncharacterized protein n=1 Tax=Glycine max TaxID=3847 RepID=K7MNA9_SOYBN|nr:hypothetical protein JHK85_049005 [Glycine max]KAH1119572.1 hypothetical protein GYH30_048096 [Glycine max]